MPSLSSKSMREYLRKSISSFNKNKLYGLLAEIEFRKELKALGFEDRISQGGWIARSEGAGNFAHHTKVFFPQVIRTGGSYKIPGSEPPRGLHTICATMHQIGIQSYYCVADVGLKDNPESMTWRYTQLGIPQKDGYHEFPSGLEGFNQRERNYNFLRYDSDVADIPSKFIDEEFTKEHLRVSFQNIFFCEMSDIDGVFWGQQYTYPIEIKEKTVAQDPRIGEYFGLDVGPFVKLAFYAAKKGNLHSLFVVREINNTTDRELVNWWFITYDKLSQYASWVPQSGGTSMRGGASAVVKIPKNEFIELNKKNLDQL